MNTVIIICNDPRIALVKEAIQPLLMAKICIVPDFDTGLKEVFEKRPLGVFIQDEIAGVKGETVTRHIKSLLQANSPQFINLDHAAGLSAIMNFSDGINLNLPYEELVAMFREHLKNIAGIRWKEQVPKPAESGPPSHLQQDSSPKDAAFSGDHRREHTAVKEDEVFSFFKPFEDNTLPLPVVEPFAFDSDETAPLTVVPETSVDRAAPVIMPKETFLPFPEAGHPSPPAPEPLSATTVDTRHEQPVRPPEPALVTTCIPEADSEELPFPVESAAPDQWSRKPLVIVAGVLGALICGVMLYLLLNPAVPKPQSGAVTSKQPIPVSASATPAKPAPSGATLHQGLPSFIPKEGIDPTYGATRPGWERYVSPRREYLIFRDNGAIKALQVIARQKEAIDAPFVSAALHELCGVATCVIRSRSSRDGYLVEQGQTSTKAEVIFYKKKGTGETRGIVISLP